MLRDLPLWLRRHGLVRTCDVLFSWSSDQASEKGRAARALLHHCCEVDSRPWQPSVLELKGPGLARATRQAIEVADALFEAVKLSQVLKKPGAPNAGKPSA